MSDEPAGSGITSGANGSAPDLSANRSIVSAAGGSSADTRALDASIPGTSAADPRLRLQAIFSVHGDDERAYAIASELIDRLSVLANLPECECDVDISLERAPSHGQGCG
jgi:hypothetical protein